MLTDSRITSQQQTCYACPEQWEGTFAGGLHFYFRFRFGRVLLGVGETEDDAVAATQRLDGYTGVSRTLGDDLQGCFGSDRERDQVFTEMLDSLMARWRDLLDQIGREP